jgi:hypothetical protein
LNSDRCWFTVTTEWRSFPFCWWTRIALLLRANTGRALVIRFFLFSSIVFSFFLSCPHVWQRFLAFRPFPGTTWCRNNERAPSGQHRQFDIHSGTRHSTTIINNVRGHHTCDRYTTRTHDSIAYGSPRTRVANQLRLNHIYFISIVILLSR